MTYEKHAINESTDNDETPHMPLLLNEEYTVDPQLVFLQTSLLSKNINSVRDVLAKFSLLRDETLYERTNVMNIYKNLNDFYHKHYLNPIVRAAMSSPSYDSRLIYEILAAGFPVCELAIKLIDINRRDGDYKLSEYANRALYWHLPHISDCAREDNNGVNISEKCVLSNKIPKVPVRIHNKLYDLEFLVLSMKENKNFEIDGKVATKVIDDAVLDLEYIQDVHAQAQKTHAQNIRMQYVGVLALSLIPFSILPLTCFILENISNKRNFPVRTDYEKYAGFFGSIILYVLHVFAYVIMFNAHYHDQIKRNIQAYNGSDNLLGKIANRFNDELHDKSEKCYTLSFWNQVRDSSKDKYADAKNTPVYNNTPAFRNILNQH